MSSQTLTRCVILTVHYHQKFYNSLSLPGLPPHDSMLEVGIPIMLEPPNMSNDTRVFINDLRENIILAAIFTGSSVG